MGQTNVGRLILKAIPNNENEKAVVRYLAKLYKNTSHEKLAGLVQRLPAVLGKRVPKKTASRLINHLKKLGAIAVFTPADATQSAEKQKPKPSAQPLVEAITGAFQKKLSAPPVSFLYRVGLFFVAILMVVLPLAYLALIGAVGYLTYHHAVVNTHILSAAYVRLSLVGYVGPIIVGVLVVLFMIKPLFARETLSLNRSVVSREREPLLFAFVEKICDVVGAPVPKKIYFNTEVNAFAGLRRGILSIFGGDLELTIGLPIMAGMNLKQFAGVLAHEFGHFSQTTGMGLSYLIRSISFWLHRVVYEEDTWDYQLRMWSQQAHSSIGLILLVARLLIWLTRKILWCFMIIGQGFSCFLLRQMEYDADRYEIGLVGSSCFESTVKRLVELSVANEMTVSQLFETWEEGRLADNMPSLLLLNAQQVPRKEMTDMVDKHVAESFTGLLDTHPSDKARIEAAQKLGAKGIFSLPASHPDIKEAIKKAQKVSASEKKAKNPPATILMRDFEGVSKTVSFHYYRFVLGDFVTRKNLISIDKVVNEQNAEKEHYDALDRFFAGQFDVHRPVVALSALDLNPPDDTGKAVEQIQAVRKEIQSGRESYASNLKMYLKAHERTALIAQAQAIIEAGITIDAKDFGLPSGEASSVSTAYQRTVERKRSLVETLKPFEDNLCERIEWNLRLLSHPPVATHFKNVEEEKSRCLQYLNVASRLEEQHFALDELYYKFSQLMGLTAQLEVYGSDESLIESAKAKIRNLRQALRDIRYQLSTTPYPFEHTEPDMTVGDYAIVYIPGEEDLGPMLEAAQDAMNRIVKLYARIAGRLATTAERVEKALGMAPLNQ